MLGLGCDRALFGHCFQRGLCKPGAHPARAGHSGGLRPVEKRNREVAGAGPAGGGRGQRLILTWFWIPFTLFATLTQTFRNGVQRNLTGYIGTLAATYVRFLYGLPFALLFLVIVHFSSGDPLPAVTLQAVMWFGLGGLAQIIATALMLAAMRQKSFVI